jgi:hypothetical protein
VPQTIAASVAEHTTPNNIDADVEESIFFIHYFTEKPMTLMCHFGCKSKMGS